MFTRSHSYQSSHTREELKKRLIGSHVKIHNLDFEVTESNHVLTIIPHAEQIDEIKTLPITSVSFEEGNGTKVMIKSQLRELDKGGPMLMMIVVILIILAGIVLYIAKDQVASYVVLGVGILLFTLFWIRMQMGYFDYVRKVKDYVKNTEKS